MVKKKELAALDTPRRRSKRLMKLKAENDATLDVQQQTNEPSSSTALPLPSEVTPVNNNMTTASDNLEDLALDVFKNMKCMLVNPPEISTCKSSCSVEQQSEMLMVENVEAPFKKILIDLHHPVTKLQSNMKETPYFSFRQADIVASHLKKTKNIIEDNNEILSKSVITNDFETQSKAPPMRISKIQKRKLRKMQTDRSAGKEWFDLPATTITPELKNDLRILKMRGALDPSRHYKKNDTKELPKYFQVGTVIEGPGEFYSARIPKRFRKSTIVDELLADDKFKRSVIMTKH